MTFWSSEKLRDRLPGTDNEPGLIDPYHDRQVVQAAYELSMGGEMFVTSSDPTEVTTLQAAGEGKPSGSKTIPPGQFAMLLTDETVRVPDDAIAFISVRYRFKKLGLINVSGFHVDPGFAGHLKFSVYNAGSGPITVKRGEQMFLIWFASLDRQTKDLYPAKPALAKTITSEDQNAMHGDVSSPAQLRAMHEELEKSLRNEYGELKSKVEFYIRAVFVVISLFVGLLVVVGIRPALDWLSREDSAAGSAVAAPPGPAAGPAKAAGP